MGSKTNLIVLFALVVLFLPGPAQSRLRGDTVKRQPSQVLRGGFHSVLQRRPLFSRVKWGTRSTRTKKKDIQSGELRLVARGAYRLLFKRQPTLRAFQKQWEAEHKLLVQAMWEGANGPVASGVCSKLFGVITPFSNRLVRGYGRMMEAGGLTLE